MYNKKSKVGLLNELRYVMFCAKTGASATDSGHLPPCQDCFQQHVKRANYQAAIWKRSLENFPEIPRPYEDHGWILGEDSNLEISWMTGSPAPETVLSLLSCDCSRKCELPTCSCLSNKMKCTPACKKKDCANMKNDEEEEEEEKTETGDEDEVEDASDDDFVDSDEES